MAKVEDHNEWNPRLIENTCDEPELYLQPLEDYQESKLVSLEEAIEPIKVLFLNLSRDVWIAKNASKNPADGLPPDESAAICLYTMEVKSRGLYSILNELLRDRDRQKLRPWFSYLKLFITALFKIQPCSAKVIYRGVKADLHSKYRPGERYIWWAFSSCTLSLAVLKKPMYLGETGPRTLFNIECTNGKSIKSHSYYKNEDEILLLPGFYFEVVSQVEAGNDLYIIHLRELSPPYVLLGSPFTNVPCTVSPEASAQKEQPQELSQISDQDLKLDEEIGRGAFGIVYRAQWLSRHRTVAVKKLHLTQLDKQAEKDFFKELLLMNNISYPHIVTFYGACTEHGKYALVMEYMSLGSLYKILHKDKIPLDWSQRLSIALQTAKGINYLHIMQPPILHRDIKSLNFLLERFHDRYIVKACDFGLAQTRSETTRKSQLIHELPFTMQWTAPEILRMKKHTTKSDVYSLGIVYWELAANEIPYDGHQCEHIRQFVLSGDRLEIPEITSSNFSTLINKCWVNDPNDRPDCSQLIKIIEECIQNQSNFIFLALL
ncbi:unnamed protein product [Rotaria sp. Silwood2]|nr:unnamed protein product [Rotaria sp. Silwood2]